MADSTPTISSAQIRAARGLIGWSQQQLADASGVSRRTVASVEAGDRDTYRSSLAALRAALEEQGIAFQNDGASEGVSRLLTD